MNEHFDKIQDDEINKSDFQLIEDGKCEYVDVVEELRRVTKKVRQERKKMSPEQREHYFNTIRDLRNKLEEWE